MRRLILAWATATLLLLPTFDAFAALGIGNRVTGTTVSGASQTTSITVSEASPLIISVFAQFGIGAPTSVTVNGSSAGAAVADVDVSDVSSRVTTYCVPNPSPGTYNVVVNWAGSTGFGANTMIITTTGGDTATGCRTASTRTNANGTGPGLTLANSQNGDIVFHAALVFASSITFDGGETTTSTEQDNPGGGGYSWGMSTKSAVGASTVVGCTDVSTYGEMAIAVIPAAGAGVDTSKFSRRIPQ